jgi:hypothetical protein
VLLCVVLCCRVLSCGVCLVSKLNHMLEAESDYQVAEERSFSDAFTELCVPTGGKAQVRRVYVCVAIFLCRAVLYCCDVM